jgi:hypothetical protein
MLQFLASGEKVMQIERHESGKHLSLCPEVCDSDLLKEKRKFRIS